ncbi:MAG: GNAT family N-acetyltransferase [Phycisphaerales bacterium]|nr:GNAT family N-acetyltransferase [Phycisphaerales bacterium]
MLIRPANSADVPAILPMVAAICSMHESWDPDRYAMLPDVIDRYARWLPQRAADPRSILLLAEDDSSKPAGFLVGETLSNIPIYRLTEYGFIHDMWVEPDVRKSGIGKALVLAAIERFRAMGIHQVRLETASLNDVARRLFESCGFKIGTIDMLRSTRR